jgi:hypothetical protein
MYKVNQMPQTNYKEYNTYLVYVKMKYSRHGLLGHDKFIIDNFKRHIQAKTQAEAERKQLAYLNYRFWKLFRIGEVSTYEILFYNSELHKEREINVRHY